MLSKMASSTIFWVSWTIIPMTQYIYIYIYRQHFFIDTYLIELLLTLFIEANSKSKRYTIQQYKHSFLQISNVHPKSYITFVIHPPLMMAQSLTESTWEITNYGWFINQFPLKIIRSIRQLERINKKYVDKKMSIMFNHIYIYIYIYIYI